MKRKLDGRRVLVVEDEHLLAECLAEMLIDENVVVLGPVGTVQDALDLLADSAPPDIALLDVKLGRTDGYPIADRLMEMQVPFVFTSAYDRRTVPQRYLGTPYCTKPFGQTEVVQTLTGALHSRAQVG